MNPAGSALICGVLLCAVAGPPPAGAQDAEALRTRQEQLREQLASNPFHRPLHLESSEVAGDLKGVIHARIEQSFAIGGPALRGVDHWCDILILHLNVKHCVAARSESGDALRVRVGRKFDQPLEDAHLFEFRHRVTSATPDYLRVVVSAPRGPLGTSDYRIVLEAVELDDRRTFLRLSYSYSQGMAANLATRIYLATVGRSKVGFSIVGSEDGGEPVYIAGTRGVVERNAMRFYLAIEAYLGALSTPAPQQLEKRLSDWFAGIERYPLQLHEMERDQYLEMKRREIHRQQIRFAGSTSQ